MTPMAHEGARLQEMLDRADKTAADLARACGVSRTAVDNYIKAAKIGRLAWRTLRPGLVKMGFDPARIKPDDVPPEVSGSEDLRPLVSGWKDIELKKLRTILEADEASRVKLLYFVDGKLHKD